MAYYGEKTTMTWRMWTVCANDLISCIHMREMMVEAWRCDAMMLSSRARRIWVLKHDGVERFNWEEECLTIVHTVWSFLFSWRKTKTMMTHLFTEKSNKHCLLFPGCGKAMPPIAVDATEWKQREISDQIFGGATFLVTVTTCRRELNKQHCSNITSRRGFEVLGFVK